MDKIALVISVVAVALLVSGVCLGVTVYSAYMSVSSVPAGGTISVSAGLGLYQDMALTTPLTSFDFGTLYHNTPVQLTCWLQNEGDVAVVLTSAVSNWSPSGTESNFVFTFSLEDQTLAVDEVRQVILTLTMTDVPLSMSDGEAFTFDAVITGTAGT